MINTNMPIASQWSTMLSREEGSPSLLPDRTKNFFDYAEVTPDNGDCTSFYDLDLDCKAIESAEVPARLIVEDFIPVEDMEATYVTADSEVILGVLAGGGVVEEVGEVVVEEMEVPTSALIPTTALEMEVGQDEELAHPEVNATFLNANLPAPLGSALSPSPSTASYPPATPSPFSPTTPTYPHPPTTPTYSYPPSTPSCQSTCSDDFVSSLSDVSTPGTSGVTSGEKFIIPLPADDKMAAATMTALETCSLTPLIKEELKYTIQSRRLAAGKPELVVDTSAPVKAKKIMTPEERERALKRREQNRMAAQRFRQKQKDTADVLIRKCHKLEGSNTTLRGEIKRLARESQELRQLLTSHLIVCPKVKVAR